MKGLKRARALFFWAGVAANAVAFHFLGWEHFLVAVPMATLAALYGYADGRYTAEENK